MPNEIDTLEGIGRFIRETPGATAATTLVEAAQLRGMSLDEAAVRIQTLALFPRSVMERKIPRAKED